MIANFAGTGTQGSSGDNGPATSAQLSFPEGIAVDGAGNVYISDALYNVVRMVTPGGVISRVAGADSVTGGFSGDNAAATSAQLNSPQGLAFAGGDLYIADSGNHRIRRVDSNGVITTIAGTGTGGFSGDGGAATSAQLQAPEDVAVDAQGRIYIADTLNHRVRKIDGGVITTIAGTIGGAGGAGSSGDGGPATAAQLSSPLGVAVGPTGIVYIADTNNARIRAIDTAGNIKTVAGPVDPDGIGPITRARLGDPQAVALAPQFTLIAGGTTGTVELIRGTTVVAAAGRYPQMQATGSSARFTTSSFGDVYGVAYDDANKRIFVTESNRVRVISVVDPANELTWTMDVLVNQAGTAGQTDGAAVTARLRNPTGLYFDPSAKQLYIADTGNHTIRAVDLANGLGSATVRTVAGTAGTRGFFGDGGSATSALLYAPRALTRCANGDLFVADTNNNRVRRIDATGTISTVLGNGDAAATGDGAPARTLPVRSPVGIACDDTGNVFVTSTTSVRLVPANSNHVVDGSGPVQTIYGSLPRDTFPQRLTSCLTGIALIDPQTLETLDSCTGFAVQLHRAPL